MINTILFESIKPYNKITVVFIRRFFLIVRRFTIEKNRKQTDKKWQKQHSGT